MSKKQPYTLKNSARTHNGHDASRGPFWLVVAMLHAPRTAMGAPSSNALIRCVYRSALYNVVCLSCVCCDYEEKDGYRRRMTTIRRNHVSPTDRRGKIRHRPSNPSPSDAQTPSAVPGAHSSPPPDGRDHRAESLDHQHDDASRHHHQLASRLHRAESPDHQHHDASHHHRHLASRHHHHHHRRDGSPDHDASREHAGTTSGEYWQDGQIVSIQARSSRSQEHYKHNGIELLVSKQTKCVEEM